MFVRRALAILIVLSTLIGVSAAAQEVARTVILKVPNDGTQALVAEIRAVPGVDLRDQKWFLDQVKARGMSPKKLLQRPADLRFVMSGSNIAYVLYVDNDDGELTGRIFAADGQLADSVPLGTEFGQVEAAEFRSLFERVLGIKTESVEAVESTPDPTPDPVAVVEADKPPRREGQDGPRGGISVGLAGRMFKRDLTYAGSNTAVLNYESALYPGFSVDGEYLLDAAAVGRGLLGFWLGLDLGFDSLATDESSLAILHLEGAAGASLNFEVLSLRLGARHVRYSLAANDVFPSLIHTVVIVGLAAREQIGRVVFEGDFEVHPWGLYHGTSAHLFGEKSNQLGFGGSASVGYAVSDSIGISAGYGARVERSSFSGAGTLDFRDSHGFELVHGPELGVTWHP